MRLSCADAGSGVAPTGAGDLAAGSLIFEGLGGEFVGSRASAAGFDVPAGPDLYFVKAPAWLPAGAGRTTVHLSSASGFLAWVPARIWTSGGATDLRPYTASTLVFAGCPDRDTTYFGGLLSTDPDLCLTLRIDQGKARAQQIDVGAGTRC